MNIELTREQEQDVKHGRSVEVVDPASAQSFVVIPREQYEHVRSLLEKTSMQEGIASGAATVSKVPAGIRCSQEAYWRDLPEILPLKSERRRWVAYHGDERIGFGRTMAELYEICERRGLKTDQFYVDRLEPRALAPWEEESVEAHFDAGEAGCDESR